MIDILHLLNEFVDYHNGSWTPLLILWILLGVIGAVFAAFNLSDAIRDMRSLVLLPKTISNDRREELWTISKSAIRQEILRLAKMFIIIITGVIGGLSTPVITDAERAQLHIPYWTPTSVVIISGLVGIVAITVLQTYFDRRLRHGFYSRKTQPRTDVQNTTKPN